MTLNLEIITPEKIIYQDTAEELIVPTSTGQITILPHHIGLLTQVSPGELIIKKNNKEVFIAILGGFLQVSENKVSILVDYAIESHDIQIAKAEEAKERAEKLLKEKQSNVDFAEIESQLRKSLLELKVAQRRKTRHSIMQTSEK